MIRLGTVVLGAGDVTRAVTFWSAVLGYEPVAFADADDEFTILRPPSGEGTRVALHRSDTPAQGRPRVHLDLIVDSDDEQATEIERLVGLGASRVSWDYPTDPDFVVLCDTEGNRFCVVDAIARHSKLRARHRSAALRSSPEEELKWGYGITSFGCSTGAASTWIRTSTSSSLSSTSGPGHSWSSS